MILSIRQIASGAAQTFEIFNDGRLSIDIFGRKFWGQSQPDFQAVTGWARPVFYIRSKAS